MAALPELPTQGYSTIMHFAYGESISLFYRMALKDTNGFKIDNMAKGPYIIDKLRSKCIVFEVYSTTKQ